MIELWGVELCLCYVSDLQLITIVISIIALIYKVILLYIGVADVRWSTHYGCIAERVWSKYEVFVLLGRVSRATTWLFAAIYQGLVPPPASDEYKLFDVLISLAIIKSAVESIAIAEIESGRISRIKQVISDVRHAPRG